MRRLRRWRGEENLPMCHFDTLGVVWAGAGCGRERKPPNEALGVVGAGVELVEGRGGAAVEVGGCGRRGNTSTSPRDSLVAVGAGAAPVPFL